MFCHMLIGDMNCLLLNDRGRQTDGQTFNLMIFISRANISLHSLLNQKMVLFFIAGQCLDDSKRIFIISSFLSQNNNNYEDVKL